MFQELVAKDKSLDVPVTRLVAHETSTRLEQTEKGYRKVLYMEKVRQKVEDGAVTKEDRKELEGFRSALGVGSGFTTYFPMSFHEHLTMCLSDH